VCRGYTGVVQGVHRGRMERTCLQRLVALLVGDLALPSRVEHGEHGDQLLVAELHHRRACRLQLRSPGPIRVQDLGFRVQGSGSQGYRVTTPLFTSTKAWQGTTASRRDKVTPLPSPPQQNLGEAPLRHAGITCAVPGITPQHDNCKALKTVPS